jgi:hypothetical protein
VDNSESSAIGRSSPKNGTIGVGEYPTYLVGDAYSRIQIIAGLKEGDRVFLSDTYAFNNAAWVDLPERR